MSDTFFTGNRQSRRAWDTAKRKYMKPGSLTILQIQHDDTCKVFTTEKHCNCNPTRVLKNKKGHILASVDNVGSYDFWAYLGSEAHD